MPSIKLYCLGSPRIEVNGRPIEVDTRKATALLAYLALTGEQHSRDKLAAFLWPEADDRKAHAALRRTLSVLNKALDGVGLEIERETVGFRREPGIWLDVDEFRQRTRPAADVQALAEAAALYRDDFMAGFTLRDSPAFDDWQFFQSEGLRRELAAVLEKLARGAGEAAITCARRWLQLDPLHEPAHRALMQLYAQSGQHAAALRQYRECVRVLDEELGVPPLAETTQLYEAIKESRGAGKQERKGETAPSPARSSALMPPSVPAPLPLVGRAAQLNALLKMYETGGKFVALEGEAGIGKTRLAEELLAHAQRDGAVTLSARCYAGQAALAYGPMVEALRARLSQPDAAIRLRPLPAHHRAEAARLLPELLALFPDSPPVPPLESPGAQSRFLEGVRQMLITLCAGSVPGVLFVDDAQWADEASLDLLAYLVRRLRETHLLILATWRGEEAPAHHRLRALLAEAERAKTGCLLSLPRLKLDAVEELVRASPLSQRERGPGGEGELSAHLYRETEGSPFFLVEYLAAMVDDPAAKENWSLPIGVRELLNTRLAAIGETGQQLLGAAAVIGRSFDLETLQMASGRSDEETVAALEELTARGLVAEVGAGCDFSHEKLRALVYEQTSLARRRLLHRRVAEALITRARLQHDLGPRAGQIARHHQLGGNEAQAAHYFKLAGEHARALYANAEALAHFHSALGLGHPETAALHEAIGDLQTLAGDYGAALKSYEAAAVTCAPEALAELERKLGNVYDRRGDWELAESHFRAAHQDLTGLGGEAARSVRSQEARLFADWSRSAHHRGHNGQAAELAQQALTLAEEARDARGLAQAHNLLGLIARRRGDWPRARAYLEQSVTLAEALNDPDARAAALNNLASICRESGDLPRALHLTEDALALCQSIGDRHREAALHNNLADLFHAQGDAEAAMRHLKQAVTLFAEIGGEPGLVQPPPGIWKLTEW